MTAMDYFSDWDEADGPPDPHGRSKALYPTAPDNSELADLSALIDAEIDAWQDLLDEAKQRRMGWYQNGTQRGAK